MIDDAALLDQLLSEAGIASEANLPALRARGRSGRLPLSFAQELLWLLDNASPGLTAYNLPVTRRIRGNLDVGALERSLRALVARHETLRTRFALVDGEPSQIVDAPPEFMLRRIDLRDVPPGERAAQGDAVATERARTPFDLAREHMLRATLVRVDEEEHILILETHHIVSDGASLGVLFRELSATYRAFRAHETLELPPLAFQYADYALCQREMLAGEPLSDLLAYWRAQLGERTEPLELPTDFARPVTPAFVGAQRSRVFEPQLLEALQGLARRHDATLYMVVLAVYATLLHRYTGRSNVLVGSNVAGRMESGTERLIGYFNNTLAMRADFAGDPPFSELLGRVRESCLGAYDHQDVPFEKLVLELRGREQQIAQAPLFDVVLTAQNATAAELELEGTSVSPYGVDMGATKFDLTLFMAETTQGLRLTLRARSDLWSAGSVERMLAQLQRVAAGVVADPEQRVSRITVLTAEETRVIAAANATAADVGTGSVVDVFETQAARVPDAAAVICGDDCLTYRELNAQANALALRLRAHGVERGTPVGLAVERSSPGIVGILGILKAEGAYVPFEPDVPAERLTQQLTESGARLVVTTAEAAGNLPFDRSALIVLGEGAATRNNGTRRNEYDTLTDVGNEDDNVTHDLRAEDFAYVLFTSGSTGVPKGVAVTHGNLASYVRAISRVLGDVPTDAAGDGLEALAGLGFALTGTLAADLGNTVLFPALCSGGTLHVLPREVTNDPARFAAYARSHPLDIVKITPSHLRALLPENDVSSVLPAHWIVLGGEVLPLDFASELVAAERCRILNHYGPTETTVGAMTFEVTASSLEGARVAGARTVPIGFPLANVEGYVLDANLQAAPLGVPGELVIAGRGVARGYLNRPEFTAERFIELTRVGRAYRTGDRVRRLPSGALEFLGRADAQVKVRGYRVDLGDIEHALARHPAVAQSAVVFRNSTDAAEPALVAYVTPKGDATPGQLRAWLTERLPKYMVPAMIATLEALPLTPSGKVDRRALLDPEPQASTDAYVAPRTETEATLATMWAEVLKRERVGTRDHFLALGGHSLLAIRILGKLSRGFGIRLPLRALFEAPTIETLAAVVDKTVASPETDDSGPLPRAATGPRGSERAQ